MCTPHIKLNSGHSCSERFDAICSYKLVPHWTFWIKLVCIFSFSLLRPSTGVTLTFDRYIPPHTHGNTKCDQTIRHTLLCLSPAGDQQQLLLDVDAAGVSSVLQWLSRYKLRRKLDLQDGSSRVAVWAAFDGQLKAGPAGEYSGVGGLCAMCTAAVG